MPNVNEQDGNRGGNIPLIMETFNQTRYAEYKTDDIAPTLKSSGGDYGVGGSEVLIVSYQKVTGPLMANSHPGSYCGQDAYSDMLITGGTENEHLLHGNRTGQCRNNSGGGVRR